MAIELMWDGKQESKKECHTKCDMRLIGNDLFDINDNNYVEGDNLDAMKVILGLSKNEVDMIYIDPPYNTGGKSFVYRDTWGSDAWLSMMYPRLELARRLLHPDGVIFVSIDKNESDYLKVIMDEIFGRKNFLIPFVWHKKNGGGNDTRSGYTIHEYVLTYSGGGTPPKFRLPLDDSQLDSYGNWDSDEKGLYKLESLKLRRGHYEPRENRRYTITHPIDGRAVEDKWRCEKGTFEKLWEDDRIYWPSGRAVPCEKKYLSERKGEGIAPSSIISNSALYNASGRKDLQNLELAAPPVSGHRRLFFDFPKPVNLMRHLLKMIPKQATVLDFFAGSCSMAQAVIEANAEDGGTRNFIMIQRPEPLEEDAPAREIGCENICDIGRERIQRVINKLDTQPTLFGDQNLSYKAFRLEATDG